MLHLIADDLPVHDVNNLLVACGEQWFDDATLETVARFEARLSAEVKMDEVDARRG
jgi:hypothetical protein